MTQNISTYAGEKELTIIHLTNEEAALFLQFQKKHAFIQLLDSLGVFELRSGKVTIHFNNLGEISGVDVQKFYKGTA